MDHPVSDVMDASGPARGRVYRSTRLGFCSNLCSAYQGVAQLHRGLLTRFLDVLQEHAHSKVPVCERVPPYKDAASLVRVPPYGMEF